MDDQNKQAKRQVYESILGLPEEWAVEGVEKDDRAKEMTFKIVCTQKVHPCPRCGAATVLYGARERTIRHLDMCAYKTFLVVKVPRIKCPEHGVMAAPVSFTDPRGHFTYEFANRILELC
ncbi:MAG: transposase family protein, partial [Treponema sp.]|nr:transposase family protein [Treponema sp.]